eukprot:g7560.t1
MAQPKKEESTRKLRDRSGRSMSMLDTAMLDAIREYHSIGGAEAKRQVRAGTGMYSDVMLLRREALRFDPSVLAAINALYEVADSNGDGWIDEKEYAEMWGVLYSAVNGPRELSKEDKDLGLSPRTALQREAHAEFMRDTSSGGGKINKRAYKQAFFQLADTWTDDLDAASYAKFLGEVLAVVSEEASDGSGRRLKKASECQQMPRFHDEGGGVGGGSGDGGSDESVGGGSGSGSGGSDGSDSGGQSDGGDAAVGGRRGASACSSDSGSGSGSGASSDGGDTATDAETNAGAQTSFRVRVRHSRKRGPKQSLFSAQGAEKAGDAGGGNSGGGGALGGDDGVGEGEGTGNGN